MCQKNEDTLEVRLDFEKLLKVAATGQSVIPCVVQDFESKAVLNLAYVNELALKHSIKSGRATFWSTSRNELWEKGLTSGDWLELIDVRLNCEQNSLIYVVKPQTEAQCHTGRFSCYYRSLKEGSLTFL